MIPRRLAATSWDRFQERTVRAMRSGLHVSSGDEFDALPALDQLPRREQTPAIELDQSGRDRQREQKLDRQHGRDGPDIGFNR